MSLRIDTSEWISGALIIGNTGLGVLAEDIPSDGENGAGYAYNDLDLPADNGKEICGRITTWPSAGTLFAYEDTSFGLTGAPDGTYTAQYQLYVDGVAVGDPATITIVIGGEAQEVAPGVGQISIEGHAPTIVRTQHQAILPGVGALGIAGHAPTVQRSAHQSVAPGVGLLTVLGHAPSVEQSTAGEVRPGTGVLSIVGHAPGVEQPIAVAPATGALVVTGHAPEVTQRSVTAILPGVGHLALTGFAPSVEQTAGRYAQPGVGVLTIVGYAPSVVVSGLVTKQYPLAGKRQTFPLTGKRQF